MPASRSLRSFVLAAVAALAVFAAGALSGCAPPSAPLYLDYTVPEEAVPAALTERLAEALAAAGWTLQASPLPTVRTEPRLMRQGMLYRHSVALEALPFREGHVRVLVHAYREAAVLGRPVKVPALDGGLRRRVVEALAPALESEGLALLPPVTVRDRRATRP